MARRNSRSVKLKLIAKSGGSASAKAVFLRKSKSDSSSSTTFEPFNRAKNNGSNKEIDKEATRSFEKPELTKAQNLSLKLARKEKNLKHDSRKQVKSLHVNYLKKANDSKVINVIEKGKVQKKPKVNPKAWNKLSKSERCRRKRIIERIAPGARVTASPVLETLDAEASLGIAVREGITIKQVVGIRKATGGAVASKYSINKQRKKILTEYCSQVEVQTSTTNSVKTFTFEETFKLALRRIGVENLPSNPTVVVSDDFGGETFKGGWYLVDLDKPCSDQKFVLIFSVKDKENYEVCKAVLSKAIESVPTWKEGCFIDNVFIKVKFIKTGDLKDLTMYNGLQGCQATCFCPICIITKSELILRKRDSPYRTLSQLHRDYEKLQELIQNAKTERAKAAAHQQCHSIKNKPVTDHFEPTHIAPGIMHVLAGSTNAIADWAKKYNKEKIEKLFKDAAVYPQGHTKKLTGNHGRILLNKLANHDIYYDGKGADLLYLLADIQQYAVAKMLSETEIAELHECVEAFVEEYKNPEYDVIAKSCQYIHMLIAHVLPFVDEHRSWGLFSDQPGEAIHKTQQRFFKKIPKRSNNANSSNKAVDQNQYFIEQSILRNRYTT